jgi:DNA-binding XRE family transcriptional regulator
MKIAKYFWSYNPKAIRETKKILKNSYHPRFIQCVYSILSMTQNTKEVFSIITRDAFKEKWPELRRYWMVQKQAMDYKAWWETIYEQIVSHKKTIKKLNGKPSELFRKIGSLIRNKRIEKNLSQKDLALRIGLRQPDISAIEAGKINVTIETLTTISKVLGIKEIPMS